MTLILVWVGATVALVAVVACWMLAERVNRDARLARVNSDEIALAHSRIDMLATGIKRVEGRLVKADQRKAAVDPDGEPDPKADPERWKQWQNRRIATRKVLQ